MGLPAALPSPLADGAEADRILTIPAADIVKRHATDASVDVAAYFEGVPEVGIYRCRATGFKYYYPFGLAGAASFYQALEQNIPGYYDEGKWEHDLVATRVQPGDKVLDIGCGRGSFLAKAKARQAIVTGLESNGAAAAEAATRGIEIIDELIEPHAARRPDYYDMVTAFQVLEHIEQPRPFLIAAKAVLKPGGSLVIAVPNDDSFLGMDRSNVLNGPPHHLGLWDRTSLIALADILDMTLETIEVEPLNHPAWFQATVERKYVPKGWRQKLWHKLGAAKILQRAIEENAAGIAGHTIFAVYRKR